jgi:hypothetical protein
VRKERGNLSCAVIGDVEAVVRVIKIQINEWGRSTETPGADMRGAFALRWSVNAEGG